MCTHPLEAYTPPEDVQTRLLKLVETAYTIAKQTFAQYSSKYSKKTYTQWQHAVLIYLKIREEETYRGIVDEVAEMPRVRRVLDLTEMPDHSLSVKPLTGVRWLIGDAF